MSKEKLYPLENVTVVLCRPKMPENIGSAARACANMGCPNLTIVAPKRWDMDKASALATPRGAEILGRMQVFDTLEEALADHTTVYATTARTGGWRKGILTPTKAAPHIVEDMAVADGSSSDDTEDASGNAGVAIVFGAEDTGLTNEEIEICGRLICIPTTPQCSSLNLSQAVLLILWEVFKLAMDGPVQFNGVPEESRPATHREQQLLFDTIKEALGNIDFLKDDNPDYWMLPVRRFVSRVGLKRNEFNLIMGICRQVNYLAKKAGIAK